MALQDDRRVVTKPMVFTVLGFSCRTLSRIYPAGTTDTLQAGDQFEVREEPDTDGRVVVERGLAFGWVVLRDLLDCSQSIAPV